MNFSPKVQKMKTTLLFNIKSRHVTRSDSFGLHNYGYWAIDLLIISVIVIGRLVSCARCITKYKRGKWLGHTFAKSLLTPFSTISSFSILNFWWWWYDGGDACEYYYNWRVEWVRGTWPFCGHIISPAKMFYMATNFSVEIDSHSYTRVKGNRNDGKITKEKRREVEKKERKFVREHFKCCVCNVIIQNLILLLRLIHLVKKKWKRRKLYRFHSVLIVMDVQALFLLFFSL